MSVGIAVIVGIVRASGSALFPDVVRAMDAVLAAHEYVITGRTPPAGVATCAALSLLGWNLAIAGALAEEWSNGAWHR